MPKPSQTPRLQPSSNAENLRDQDRDNKMASDGRKLEDEEHVGARSPDADADAEHANADPQPDPPAKGEKEPSH